MLRIPLGAALAAVLAAAIALPAAAATIDAEASATITLSSSSEGIALFTDPGTDAFEDPFGDASASAEAAVESTDGSATLTARASATVGPFGDALAGAAAFPLFTVENAAATAGTVVFDYAYALTILAGPTAPGEFVEGYAETYIRQFGGPEGDAELLDTIFAIGVETPGIGFVLNPVPGLAASGTETITLTIAPFSTAYYEAVVDTGAFAVSSVAAVIPLPASGILLIAALGGLAAARRRAMT